MPGTPIGPRPDPADRPDSRTARGVMWPLYAAGFTTAFGAHGVAANLAGFNHSTGGTLLTLGILSDRPCPFGERGSDQQRCW